MVKEWAKCCTDCLCICTRDITIMMSSSYKFQCVCPIQWCTKPIFQIFFIFLKNNRIMPFCNLFIERPSYFTKIFEKLLVWNVRLTVLWRVLSFVSFSCWSITGITSDFKHWRRRSDAIIWGLDCFVCAKMIGLYDYDYRSSVPKKGKQEAPLPRRAQRVRRA